MNVNMHIHIHIDVNIGINIVDSTYRSNQGGWLKEHMHLTYLLRAMQYDFPTLRLHRQRCQILGKYNFLFNQEA